MPIAAPYGGVLVDQMADAAGAENCRRQAEQCPSWTLTHRQLCDLELLLNGAFSPLRGFLTCADYESVCEWMRLADGRLWPLPITLDVTAQCAASLSTGGRLALRDHTGSLLAVLQVEDVWQPDREREACAIFGSTSDEHPGVAELRHRTHPFYVGGSLVGLGLPHHGGFRGLRLGPRDIRAEFSRRNWSRVAAFQTRNPIHRAHFELTARAAAEADAHLLVHPVVGQTMPGDVDAVTRVRCYQAVMPRYPAGLAMLGLIPLAMRMAGPREALLHAIVRRNYGCTHLIVGRDHAGPGNDSEGRPFYGPYEAQDLLRAHASEVGVSMIPFRNLVYAPGWDGFIPDDEVPAGTEVLTLSGTDLRRRLARGEKIPTWFTFPEVAHELANAYPPRTRQGFTIFLTGLSGSGKSTIAEALETALAERAGRRVTLLDGDEVRKLLSSELGFSREHRDLHIRRLGYVAAEVTRHGGIAICAAIAPYDEVRRAVRQAVSRHGGFVLVHVSTPLAECERRDRKGLYAKARAGLVQQFTGISDPYEPPADAELAIDTSQVPCHEAVETILGRLASDGYLSGAGLS